MLAVVLNPLYRLGHVENLTYTPLITGLAEIRLLQLTSATSAHLRTVPLDSTPYYYALSYAWGDPTPAAPYTVNGKKILIANFVVVRAGARLGALLRPGAYLG